MTSTTDDKRALLAKLLQEKVTAPAPRRSPLSFAQERMWFLDQWSPGSPALHMPVAVRLSGQLEPAVLERSLQALVLRHEALRTTFTLADGRPVQLVAPALVVVLPVEDLRTLPAGEREAQALRRVAEVAREPFDLSRGPLFRARLFALAAQEHLLLFAMHHAVSDGWSMGVIVQELTALYRAFSEDRASPLPRLPLQYADYAVWQRQAQQGEEPDAQLAWWRERLDPHAVLELPTDRPRPAVLGTRGAREALGLSAALTLALKALARHEGRTLFVTLLAAFQALLHRYTGQEDLAVGTPVANRPRAELEGLIGLFVNTVVLRGDLSGDPSFRELMARLQPVALDAFARQELPFERLVDALRPGRDLGRAPLFQVMFILQNAPLPPLEAPGLRLEARPVDTGSAQFDLTVIAEDLAQGLRLTAEYNTDLFEPGTVHRLLAHLERLLEGAVAAPDQRLSRLPLLTPTEREQLLVDWSGASAPFPHEGGLHGLFEAQVQRTPDAVALTFEGAELTYRQLDARANQWAWHLRGLGVGPETYVGLCATRSFDLVVGMLATLKAGGAYAPLDPTYPAARLAFMLQDSAVRVLLAHRPLLAALPPTPDARAVCFEDGVPDADASRPPPWRALPDSPAYVIYTSGSTGQPKGVVATHRATCNVVMNEARVSRLGPGSRVLQFSNPGFDVSVVEIFATLTSGGTLCLAPAERLMPGEPLRQLLREQAITVLNATPTALAATDSADLPVLRTVFSGGEACTAELVARWGEGRRFINGYGPSETTVTATAMEVRPEGRAPPLGRPLLNVRVYVLDATLEPVPVGLPGELCIGGVGLARGYLHLPGTTAERFVPSPFGTEPGARLYRTGDRARWRPDGELEFLGRLDGQVKLRGFRIELGEIEAALRQHPAVAEAAVLIRDTPAGGQRLVAWLVPAASGTAPTAKALHDFLVERLPPYMVPSAFVAVPDIPLTANGKRDVAALPPPEAGALDSGRTFEAPRTELEERLARLWTEVLQVERVGLDDPFFELGGNSLLALRLHQRLRAELGVELPLTVLFQHSTVRALAERMSAGGPSDSGAEAGRARSRRRQAFARKAAVALASDEDGDTGDEDGHV
ncbi:non-ribosomal peptide synthetase [Corallococcus llansteffanensis]|uniref:Amino acid adenylation domain-containing protein n=1 Tax=Corallococcus llansteffanensis TaxID=2316731 RepID=A0A3A8PXX5_9BACT|nr:non-ribosomal peptide synthetase [Corallococcus llansteffanensis]RKH58625.1 amino acid adenylation domain-containing protein [Corallococcus llansteffanensis]